MKLAVIILNWNGVEVMKRFLPSVVANTVGDEVRVVVADNASSDGSVGWLRENYPEVELIQFRENYGYAGGYNRAVRIVGAPYSLLLNSDVEVGEGWWQPLLAFMEEHPDAGALQPKVLAYNDKDKFEHAGAAGGLMDCLGYPYCRGRVMGSVEADAGQYDSPEAYPVAWASGAALMVRTSAFEQVGGFDESFFAHMEEIDLCWRLLQAGYGVLALSSSKVWHLGGGALPYGNPRKTYLNFRNNLLMLYKNMPRRAGRSMLLRRRLADVLAFGGFVLKGQFADAKAILRAHGDFRKMKNNYREFPEKNIFKDLPGTDRSVFFMKRK